MTNIGPNISVGVLAGQSVVGGTATALGVVAAKSFAYDEAQYVYSVSVPFVLGTGSGVAAATGGVSNFGGTFAPGACAIGPAFAARQLRSLTVLSYSTGAGTGCATSGDNIRLFLISPNAQAFGTATATSLYVTAGISTGTLYGTQTTTTIGANLVTITCAAWNFSGTTTPVQGTGSFAGGYNPAYLQIAGGTCTVVVACGAGTNTQVGYVFPVGAQGGLSVGAGDLLIVSKSATDTSAAYLGEAEFTYTPGAYVTR